jgi:hypothetical protein
VGRPRNRICWIVAREAMKKRLICGAFPWCRVPSTPLTRRLEASSLRSPSSDSGLRMPETNEANARSVLPWTDADTPTAAPLRKTEKPRLSGAFRMVGAPRFELGTSSPPDWRANQAAPRPARLIVAQGFTDQVECTAAEPRPREARSRSSWWARAPRGSAHIDRGVHALPPSARARRPVGWGFRRDIAGQEPSEGL